MLNPSGADEERDDPTIRRCVRFARTWGFGSLEVVNLFALVATDPRALLKSHDPIGPHNDAAIRSALETSDTVVLAWGNHGLIHTKRAALITAITLEYVSPYCLGLTMRGAPRHPLRLPKTTTLKPFWLKENLTLKTSNP